MENNIGLFDLDNSLADYTGGLNDALHKLMSEEEIASFKDLWEEYDEKPFIRARIRLIKSQPGFWLNLLPILKGFAILKTAKDIGFNIHILTKGPKKLPAAWQEKVLWAQKYLGQDADIHITSDKGMVYGKFLYDDFPDYMLRWLKNRPRGLGIMPVTNENKSFTHPNVIKWDGKNYDEIVDALKNLYNKPKKLDFSFVGNDYY